MYVSVGHISRSASSASLAFNFLATEVAVSLRRMLSDGPSNHVWNAAEGGVHRRGTYTTPSRLHGEKI